MRGRGGEEEGKNGKRKFFRDLWRPLLFSPFLFLRWRYREKNVPLLPSHTLKKREEEKHILVQDVPINSDKTIFQSYMNFIFLYCIIYYIEGAIDPKSVSVFFFWDTLVYTTCSSSCANNLLYGEAAHPGCLNNQKKKKKKEHVLSCRWLL